MALFSEVLVSSFREVPSGGAVATAGAPAFAHRPVVRRGLRPRYAKSDAGRRTVAGWSMLRSGLVQSGHDREQSRARRDPDDDVGEDDGHRHAEGDGGKQGHDG